MYVLGHAYKANRRRPIRRNLLTTLQTYLPSSQSYGNPPVDEEKARALLADLLQSIPDRSTVKTELDNVARETLQDLGYLQWLHNHR